MSWCKKLSLLVGLWTILGFLKSPLFLPKMFAGNIQYSLISFSFQIESKHKTAVTNLYQDINKNSSANRLLFLTGLPILKLYYFMWSMCNRALFFKTLCWILFLTAFFKVTKIPIIQYRIEVDSREKFNIVCLPASFNIVSWHWNSLTHWNIKCICHIYWWSILYDHI